MGEYTSYPTSVSQKYELFFKISIIFSKKSCNLQMVAIHKV